MDAIKRMKKAGYIGLVLLMMINLTSCGFYSRGGLFDEVMKDSGVSQRELDEFHDEYESQMDEVEDAFGIMFRQSITAFLYDEYGAGAAGYKSAFGNFLVDLVNKDNMGRSDDEALDELDELIISQLEQENEEEEKNTLELAQSIINTLRGENHSLDKVKLLKMQLLFPDGDYWNHICVAGEGFKTNEFENSVTKSPCDRTNHYAKSAEGLIAEKVNCNHCDDVGQCYGFARKLFHTYYDKGEDKAEIVSLGRSELDNLQPGDMVRTKMYSDTDHSIFVYAVNGNNVTYAECNVSDRCQISWNRKTTISNLKSKTFISLERLKQ